MYHDIFKIIVKVLLKCLVPDQQFRLLHVNEYADIFMLRKYQTHLTQPIGDENCFSRKHP